jgi:hypothetical protein
VAFRDVAAQFASVYTLKGFMADFNKEFAVSKKS